MPELLAIRRTGPYSRRYKVVRYDNGNIGVYAFSVRGGWWLLRVFERHPWSVAALDMRDVSYFVRRRFG